MDLMPFLNWLQSPYICVLSLRINTDIIPQMTRGTIFIFLFVHNIVHKQLMYSMLYLCSKTLVRPVATSGFPVRAQPGLCCTHAAGIEPRTFSCHAS